MTAPAVNNAGFMRPTLIRRATPPTLTELLLGTKPLTPTVDPKGIAAALYRLADPCALPIGINTGMDWLRKYRERNLPNIMRGLRKIALGEALELPHHHGTLYASVRRGKDGDVLDYGLVSCRMVTTAGAAFLVDAWQNLLEPEIMKYHGVGTGTAAEAVGDTALGAEVTTGLNPDSTRATGTLAEGASSNVFRSVGTNTFDATLAITEHMLLSQAATGGGTGFDRSVFAAINVVSTDQLQSTYDWTLATGG